MLPSASIADFFCARVAPQNQRGSNDSPASAYNHAKIGVGSTAAKRTADQSCGYRGDIVHAVRA